MLTVGCSPTLHLFPSFGDCSRLAPSVSFTDPTFLSMVWTSVLPEHYHVGDHSYLSSPYKGLQLSTMLKPLILLPQLHGLLGTLSTCCCCHCYLIVLFGELSGSFFGSCFLPSYFSAHFSSYTQCIHTCMCV